MIRRVATALAGAAVLAAAAGCANQESFGLPDLTPRGAAPGVQIYPGYGYGFGAGYPAVTSRATATFTAMPTPFTPRRVRIPTATATRTTRIRGTPLRPVSTAIAMAVATHGRRGSTPTATRAATTTSTLRINLTAVILAKCRAQGTAMVVTLAPNAQRRERSPELQQPVAGSARKAPHARTLSSWGRPRR